MTLDRHIPWRNIGALLAVFCVAFAIVIWVPRASHLVLLFIGLALIASGAAPLLHQGALRGWQRRTALLTHVEEKRIEVPEAGSLPRPYRYPAVSYRYSVEGQDYDGDKVTLDPPSAWVGEHNAWGDPTPSDRFWWRTLQAGDKIPVYIDPHDPEHAVLMRNPDSRWHSQPLTLVIAGVLLIGLWLILQLFSEPLG